LSRLILPQIFLSVVILLQSFRLAQLREAIGRQEQGKTLQNVAWKAAILDAFAA